MGTPYSMETPTNFSFACTRTPFVLRIVNPDTKAVTKVAFYIENLQVIRLDNHSLIESILQFCLYV